MKTMRKEAVIGFLAQALCSLLYIFTDESSTSGILCFFRGALFGVFLVGIYIGIILPKEKYDKLKVWKKSFLKMQ